MQGRMQHSRCNGRKICVIHVASVLVAPGLLDGALLKRRLGTLWLYYGCIISDRVARVAKHIISRTCKIQLELRPCDGLSGSTTHSHMTVDQRAGRLRC